RPRKELKQTFAAQTTFGALAIGRFDHRQIDTDDDRNFASCKRTSDHRHVRPPTFVNCTERFRTGTRWSLDVPIHVRLDNTHSIVAKLLRMFAHHRGDVLPLYRHELELLTLTHLRVKLCRCSYGRRFARTCARLPVSNSSSRDHDQQRN